MAKYLKPQTPLQHQSGDYIYPITTIDQVLMDNGERLNANIINIQLDGAPEDNINFGINADTLGGQKPEYYATAEDLAALNDNKLSMELVWENASPTSAFAEQTISIDFSKYNALLVEFFGVSNEVKLNAYIGKDCTVHLCTPYSSFYYRSAYFNSQEVVFSSGMRITAYNGWETVNIDSVCIPTKIYGIKGVPT